MSPWGKPHILNPQFSVSRKRFVRAESYVSPPKDNRDFFNRNVTLPQLPYILTGCLSKSPDPADGPGYGEDRYFSCMVISPKWLAEIP